jgi:hypothetical protein
MELDIPTPPGSGAPTVGSILMIDVNEFKEKLADNTLIRNDRAYTLTNLDNLMDTAFNCRAVTIYNCVLESFTGDFQFCMFYNCKFVGSFLMANFDNAFFQDCDFSNVEFRDCSFENATFSNVNLKQSKLTNCYLRGSSHFNVDFTGAVLKMVDLRETTTEDVVGLTVQSSKVFDKPYPTYYDGKDAIQSGNPDSFFNPVLPVPLPIAPIVNPMDQIIKRQSMRGSSKTKKTKKSKKSKKSKKTKTTKKSKKTKKTRK